MWPWEARSTKVKVRGRFILTIMTIVSGQLISLFFVQSLSCVQLFATPWTAVCQASLSLTISWSLLKLVSIESVMPSNHLILCCSLLLPSIFPSIRVFSNESLLASSGQRIGVSASASVLPMNIQDWFLLELTGWISLLSKRILMILKEQFKWNQSMTGVGGNENKIGDYVWRQLFRKLLLQRDMAVVRRRQWHPTPELLPGKSHGWRSLVGCSPWGR